MSDAPFLKLFADRPDDYDALLDALTPSALAAMPWLWSLWARPRTQLPPAGVWSTWLIMGGRGSGKTRAGAEWIRAEVEGATPLAAGRRRRIALVAETADQARDVMVLGESGLMQVTPPDRRPVLSLTRRHLEWPNGAEGWLFSASDPESLRGPQFDAAWCDELAKWRRAEAAWDMLQFGLRLGDNPQQVVTTTPRRNPVLERLLTEPDVAVSRAPTSANAAHLAPAFLARVEARYRGTRLGRQELDGELLMEAPGALWSRDMLEGTRLSFRPECGRLVVAVDPPVTGGPSADACGIVVAGHMGEGPDGQGRAVVLADWSVQGKSPRAWAERAVAAYHAFAADRLIAEVNQGGDMVEEIIRQIDGNVAFKPVRATRGKVLRAEPVAALYEQGRVHHYAPVGGPGLARLEDQMCSFGRGGYSGGRSPDRVDALVWAIGELLLGRSTPPRVRRL